MSVKQKIDEILKRYGVSYGEFNGRTFIDERYVAKLEKLVRHFGEMIDELDYEARMSSLEKLLDEMGAKK